MTRAERAALREQGYTLQAIADREGVSKQAVHQSLTTEYRPATLERVAYPAVKRWMIENRISIAKLNRMLGLPHDGGYHVRTAKFLKGEVCHKDLIDGVLRLSGMKYEEAFAE
jgi:hypothetical protein